MVIFILTKVDFDFRIINLPSLNVPLNPASGPVREIRLKHQVPSRKIRDEPERYLMWRKIAGK